MKTLTFTCVILALGLSAPAIASPVQWTKANGGNGHWYEVITLDVDKIGWKAAKKLAKSSSHLGQAGYLATITRAGEQSFLNGLNANSNRAWLGGTDVAVEGTWKGIKKGHTNWMKKANKEDSTLRDYLAGWVRGDKWRDCRKRGCNVSSYVVEYKAAPAPEPGPSPVPLPATLPFIIAGMGMLGFIGRRRKKS